MEETTRKQDSRIMVIPNRKKIGVGEEVKKSQKLHNPTLAEKIQEISMKKSQMATADMKFLQIIQIIIHN